MASTKLDQDQSSSRSNGGRQTSTIAAVTVEMPMRIREPMRRADRPQDVCLIGTGRAPLHNGGQRLHARLEDGVHLHVRAVEALRALEVSDRV